ncbi:hypothetical protein APTSU1_001666200 [Apodemus speciosus]|uniref:Uncharacterized protein n=1 Tax=Apodemus speciosus TaxID=105296 RepID=A0ABQ0FQ95_APOSI
MKKIFSMPPPERRAHEGRRRNCCEVSKVSQAEMGVPVAMLRLEVIKLWDQNHLTLGKTDATAHLKTSNSPRRLNYSARYTTSGKYGIDFSHLKTGLGTDGEATTAEKLGSVRETPSASFLTQMELKMKSIRSAIAEVNTQECLVKKELDAMKQLYRGELEHIDSMALENV